MKLKMCKHCNELLTEECFYKREKSLDGLQDWCKKCQAESNQNRVRKIKLQKRNTKLKRLSTMHLNYGFKYHLKSPGSEIVVYTCLDCGRTAEENLDTVWLFRGKCKHCANKNAPKPLFTVKSEHSSEEKILRKRLISSLINKSVRSGVKYHYEEGKKRHGVYRNIIVYNCPNCGKLIKGPIDVAVRDNFLCQNCLGKQGNVVHSPSLLGTKQPQNYFTNNTMCSCNSVTAQTDDAERLINALTKNSGAHTIIVQVRETPKSTVNPMQSNPKLSWFQKIKKIFKVN